MVSWADEIKLEKFYGLPALLEPWKGDQDVIDVISEVEKEELALKAMLDQAANVPSNSQVHTELTELITFIDQGTTKESMPIDNKNTLVKNVETLTKSITSRREAIDNLITGSETTAVASAA